MPLEPEQVRKIWIALGVSVAVHLSVLVFAEISSNRSPDTKPTAPVVEISRTEAEGTTRPFGSGDSSRNSIASREMPGVNTRMKNYNAIEAGMPVDINVPKPSQTPPPNFTPQTNTPPANSTTTNQGVPVYSQEGGQTNPATNPQTRQNNPAVSTGGQAASTASAGSVAGNQNQRRSRGPNRAAFPIETIEPDVDSGMIGAGVTNSVEVTVDIAADGSHVERIVRSSGSADVDARVLEAMKQWKWDPAANEGTPIASNQAFKYTFKPR